LRNLEFETWDHGRLRVNRAFAELLRAHNLTTFDALMHSPQVEVTKSLQRERATFRMNLQDGDAERGFYLKRHGPGPWKEYLKSFVRLRWPILGARNEWNAILRFHKIGIPTMTPVALGEHSGYSFLMTEAIEDHVKLSDWMAAHLPAREAPVRHAARQILRAVAQVARSMHRAGLHHQDFYAGHLLLPRDRSEVRVIDLGRARARFPLRSHWIVKDLAQLHYSTGALSRGDCMRFLREYFGRPLTAADRRLIRRVQAKSQAIARHSRKNSL